MEIDKNAFEYPKDTTIDRFFSSNQKTVRALTNTVKLFTSAHCHENTSLSLATFLKNTTGSFNIQRQDSDNKTFVHDEVNNHGEEDYFIDTLIFKGTYLCFVVFQKRVVFTSKNFNGIKELALNTL